MKANELRLGNLVTATLTNEIYEIGIWALRVIEDGNYQNSYDTETKVYKPIPLTEEWLLKFGFKKQLDKSFAKNDFSIFLDKRFKTNLFLQENQEDFKWFSYELKVEYIHQLQNLYFALTGEELKIKEDESKTRI